MHVIPPESVEKLKAGAVFKTIETDNMADWGGKVSSLWGGGTISAETLRLGCWATDIGSGRLGVIYVRISGYEVSLERIVRM